MYLPRFIFLLLLPLRFFLPSYFNFLISSRLLSFSPFSLSPSLFRFDFSSGSVTFFSSPFPSLVSRQGDQIYHGNSSSKRSNQRWKKKRNRKVFLSEHSSKIPTPRKRGLIRCGNWPDIIYQSGGCNLRFRAKLLLPFSKRPRGGMNEDSTAAVRYLDRGITAIKV